jgi:hypothetical protein
MTDNWIKSTERLPEIGQRCIVAWADQFVAHTASILKDEMNPGKHKWLASNGHTVTYDPLYWMPCPDMPPKERK